MTMHRGIAALGLLLALIGPVASYRAEEVRSDTRAVTKDVITSEPKKDCGDDGNINPEEDVLFEEQPPQKDTISPAKTEQAKVPALLEEFGNHTARYITCGQYWASFVEDRINTECAYCGLQEEKDTQCNPDQESMYRTSCHSKCCHSDFEEQASLKSPESRKNHENIWRKRCWKMGANHGKGTKDDLACFWSIRAAHMGCARQLHKVDPEVTPFPIFDGDLQDDDVHVPCDSFDKESTLEGCEECCVLPRGENKYSLRLNVYKIDNNMDISAEIRTAHASRAARIRNIQD